MGLAETAGHLMEAGVLLRNPILMLSMARIPEADGSSSVPRQMDSAATMLTSRITRKLYGSCTGSSLVLLNETFSTTSFEEGYFIAVDAVKALLQRGVRAVYNTHMHKLAKELDAEINTGETPGRAVSLVAETKEGKNSFRVTVAPPEGRSFAREIAVKYGVTYDALVNGGQ